MINSITNPPRLWNNTWDAPVAFFWLVVHPWIYFHRNIVIVNIAGIFVYQSVYNTGQHHTINDSFSQI